MGEQPGIPDICRSQKYTQLKGVFTLILAEDFHLAPPLVAVLIN